MNRQHHSVPLLSVENLVIDIETVQETVRILDGVSFELRAGQTLGIIGESGAGKSMLGLALLGLIRVEGAAVRGKVCLHGKPLDLVSERDMRGVRGRRIGMILQDPMASLNPVRTIGSQLVETLRFHFRMSAKLAGQKARHALEEVGIADAARRLEEYPHQFSGGMRQRVAIALALAAEPELLIADEPTTALDASTRLQILELLYRLRRARNMAILIISHDMSVIQQWSDHVLVLRRGKQMEYGGTAALMARPQSAYTQELIAAIPSLWSRKTRLPVAGRTDPVAAISAPTPAQTYVKVRGLTRHFDTGSAWRLWGQAGSPAFTAVDDVSFEIKRGTTLGIVGESGSGKSTIAQMLAGLLTPSAGSITIDGQAREKHVFVGRCQMVFQDPYGSLNPRWRVWEIVTEPMRALGVVGNAKQAIDAARMLLQQVGLDPDAVSRFPHQFSGGQRQRIAIARALSSKPEFIIFDEPTSALDVSVQAEVLNLMRDLQEQSGMTYLFISHDLAVVRFMSDEVCVMRRGKIVEQGTTAQIFDAPFHAYTQSLLLAADGRRAPPGVCQFHTDVPPVILAAS